MVSGLSSTALARDCDRPGSGVAKLVRIGRQSKQNFGHSIIRPEIPRRLHEGVEIFGWG